MTLGVKRSVAFAARALRRTLPASRSRRFIVGGIAAAVVLLGSTAAAAIPSSTTAHNQVSRVTAGSPGLPGFKQGFVSVDGGRIHYVIGGTGPVLVLLHGWPETWWEWHSVMPAFAKTHTVVAFDLPGLGESSPPPSNDNYTAVETANLIRQAVHALGYCKIEILAHDLGVLVAYAYARDHPNEVTRLGVLDSPLNGFGLESAYTLSFHFLLNMAAPPTPEDMINNEHAEQAYQNYIYHFAHILGPVYADRYVYYRAYANPANREAGYNYYRAFPKNEANNLKNVSHQLTIPVLAMGGQFAFGAGVAASFDHVGKDIHEVIAPDSGHFIPEEVPHFLAECAGTFFSTSSNPVPPPGYPSACTP